MSWLTTIKRSTADLLLPRARAAGKEPQPHSTHDAASRPPLPLIEQSSALLTQPPLLQALRAGSPSSHRSVVTHAVLGSEAAGMQSLPHELLFIIFSKLDAPSLCRLAQVSTSAATFADDPLVWGRSPVGHCKETERARHLHAVQLRIEQEEAEARWQLQRWRRWRRRALGVLQAVCGVALILLPVIAGLRRRADSNRARHHQPPPSLHRLDTVIRTVETSTHHPKYESIVWNAATTCGRAART